MPTTAQQTAQQWYELQRRGTASTPRPTQAAPVPQQQANQNVLGFNRPTQPQTQPQTQPLPQPATQPPAQAPGWWSDPQQAIQFLNQLQSTGPTMPDVSPDSLNNLRAQQAQQLIDRNQEQYRRDASSLAGYLGGLNMNQSGLGIGTLSEQAISALRANNEAATNMGAIEAQNNLDYARYVGDYGLNRFNSMGNLALGFGNLGSQSRNQENDLAIRQQQLSLNRELGLGELGLNRELGVGRLGLDRDLGIGQLDLNRQLGLGDLGVREKQLGQQNEQFYAGQNFTAGQADKDRAFQLGVQDRQYSFQGKQSDLTRAHEVEIAQLAATNQRAAMELQQAFQAGQSEADRMFQGGQAGLQRQTQLDLADKQAATQLQQLSMSLADAAAGRTQASQQFLASHALSTSQLAAQIDQNRTESQIQLQQLQNQLQLGMGGLNIQQQQVNQSGQQQQMSGLTSFLGLGAQGLNMSNPLSQQVLGMYGVGTGGGNNQINEGSGTWGGKSWNPAATQAQRPQPSFEQFLTSKGYPAWYADYNWSTPNSPSAKLAAEYSFTQGGTQGSSGNEPLWTAKPPTWSEVAALQQVQNQSQANQMDYSYKMAGLNKPTTPTPSPGPATKNSLVSGLPDKGQAVYNAIVAGGKVPGNVGRSDLEYWAGKIKDMGLVPKPDIMNWMLSNNIGNRQTGPIVR